MDLHAPTICNNYIISLHNMYLVGEDTATCRSLCARSSRSDVVCSLTIRQRKDNDDEISGVVPGSNTPDTDL